MQTAVAQHRAAVSTLSATVVHGPVCEARVVASTRLGAYLLVDAGAAAGDGAVLPVLTADALALPTALRLAHRGTGSLPLCVGDRVSVGGGRVTAGGLCVEAVRTFRPARVRRVGDVRRVSHPSTALRTSIISQLRDYGGRELIGQIGRGPGLTPEADDELAGILLIAFGVGAAVPDLEPHLHRTTTLSASLLRAAAQGYAVPAVVAYVDAVLASDRTTRDRLRPQVEAIGHTSGPALLRGIHAAATSVESARLAEQEAVSSASRALSTGRRHNERTVA